MNRFRLALLVCCWLVCATGESQQRLIRLEIFVGSAEELGSEHTLMENLENVGADNIKISKAGGIPKISATEVVNGGVVSVKIIGVLNGRELILPGGKFSIRDKTGIADYLQKIRDDGSNVALAEKKAFGMTSEQLVELNDDLSKVITTSSKGVSAMALIEQLAGTLKTKVVIDKDIQLILQGAGSVRDELKDFSVGTAMAAAIRPLGLVVQPRRLQGKPVEIAIIRSVDAKEFWPIGWPIDTPLSKAEPKLMEKLDVEIRDFNLTDAVQAIQTRIGVPMLFDHNSLAEKEIDPNVVTVTFVKQKSPYINTLEKILAQTKPSLRVEVRMDEAGKPFLWIY